MREWKSIYKCGFLYIYLHIYMHIQRCLHIQMTSNVERGWVWGNCFRLLLFLSRGWHKVRGMVTKITWVNFSWGFLLKDIVNDLRDLIHYWSSKECWYHRTGLMEGLWSILSGVSNHLPPQRIIHVQHVSWLRPHIVFLISPFLLPMVDPQLLLFLKIW